MIDLEKSILKGIYRHEAIYRYTPCMELAEPIIVVIRHYLCGINIQDVRVSIYENAIKFTMVIYSNIMHKSYEVWIDYNYENPQNMLISTFNKGVLMVKEQTLSEFKITLDSILDILEKP
jgi:uncharacterized ubiquitin-like protein YukD